MATYYCDLDSDYTDATGADHAGNEYTGVGGLQAAIRGTGNATALAAGDTLYVKGTGNLGRLVKIDVGTDISGTGLGWALGDEVENDIGSGDDWTGVICEVGVGGDNQTILVELDSGYTTSDVADADGVANTTQSEGWNPQDSHSCPGIQIDTNSGDTTDGHIKIIGVASDWSTGNGDTSYCATLDGQSVATYNIDLDSGQDRIWLENVILENASSHGLYTSTDSNYDVFRYCIIRNAGGIGVCRVLNLLYSHWEHVIVASNTNAGIYWARQSWFRFCTVNDNGGHGFDNASTHVKIIGCVIHGNGSRGVDSFRTGTLVASVIDGNGGGGVEIDASNGLLVAACRITNNGGYGVIDNSTGHWAWEDANVFYNNTSGERSGVFAGDHSQIAASAAEVGYVDRPNDDFRLTADAILAGEQAAAIDLDWTDAIHPNTAYITAGIPREYTAGVTLGPWQPGAWR